ncbi:NlpC/P60 family protein [Mycolicibacterium sp. P9-64]|uniref:NlpC/P60 family peptidoglycan-binding protein RipD n=1 Tax=Mycolicibacterium sp. P9-64 TaxID=2024612 RepID=UPI0011EF408D|nr:NlpC/P60 family peptidoglycan-binding protein RipD [Mycolicibacterium sp. P9-64]KAA0081859.1 NlpC/P60 family protein [Mycolicibacterium sp. P9-64]
MKRIYALAIGVGLLMATPGLASADPYAGPVSRQQAIQYVISRALAQRGVPYTYGGGNAQGPTLGAKPAADTADSSITGPAAVPGLQTPQISGLAPAPALGAFTPTPALGTLDPAPAPTVVGFDASGLVQYAFAGVGIKLPRSSGQQYAALQKVAPSQALPGDLIFFGPEGSDSVALFLGNGQMLEATNPAVVVSPVRTNNMTPYLGRVIAQ